MSGVVTDWTISDITFTLRSVSLSLLAASINVFQGHTMKVDYEAIALAKAEAKGQKEVAHYRKKLAKDLKIALKAAKS